MGDFLLERDSRRDAALIEELVIVWKKSVEATHHFLTEQDIVDLRPLVEAGVKEIADLILAKDKLGRVIGFMGIEHHKIEMLFVCPQYFGQGIGSKLVTYATDAYKIEYVDVNEQNQQACGFYQHMGFVICGRSELDDQGKPFPILHLKKDKNKK